MGRPSRRGGGMNGDRKFGRVTTPWLALAVAAVAGGTFAADLRLTLGASAAPLYEIAVLLALWARRRWFAVGVAALVSALILAEAVATAQQPGSSTAFNRAMTLLAAWSTAVLVVLYKHKEEALRARERETQAFLDIAAVGIVATDAEGRVVLINRKGCEILGVPSEAVLGRPWVDEFVPPEHREDAAAVHGRLLAGEVEPDAYYELPLIAASGERRTVAWRSAVMRDDDARIRGILSSGEDITERRRAEETARAQQALARVGQMAAVVAHEVRNPLAGIRGAIQVLGGRLPPGETDRTVVKAVLERLDGLTEITDELLSFARPRAHRPAPVSLRRILEEAALVLADGGEYPGVSFEIGGEDRIVMADARSLKGAFSNLFLNAAQATERFGVVRARMEAVGGAVQVTVVDHGRGIPPEWRDRVFEPFFTTRHRGTGLGLAIVKRDIEAHGGTIHVTCPPEGGTTVVVTVPLAPRHG